MVRIGENGWRARFDEGFDVDAVTRVASAAGSVWAEGGTGATVLVGYGVRRDSQTLAETAAEVLASWGLAAVVSDAPCPAPALEWCAARDPRCVGALMVGGGDAPAEYGFLALRGGDGGPLSASLARRMNARMSNDIPEALGSFTTANFVSPYRAALMGEVRIPVVASRAPQVVVDPMHGACGGILAGILRTAGCDVTVLHESPEEDFGGLHPRADDPWVDGCEREVERLGADLGIVLDGDGTRCAIVDERGLLVSPHNMAPLVLGHVVRNRGLTGRVVVTLPCSMRIRWQAEQLGCEVTSVPVGFPQLHAEVEEGDVLMACDEYGGICLPFHLNERDGLLTALLMVELVSVSGRSMSELVSSLQSSLGHMRYAREDVRLDVGAVQALGNVLPGLNPREVAGAEPVLVSHADGLRLQFADGSWLMLRPSRDFPVARVCAEAPDPARLGGLLSAAVALARDAAGAARR